MRCCGPCAIGCATLRWENLREDRWNYTIRPRVNSKDEVIVGKNAMDPKCTLYYNLYNDRNQVYNYPCGLLAYTRLMC